MLVYHIVKLLKVLAKFVVNTKNNLVDMVNTVTLKSSSLHLVTSLLLMYSKKKSLVVPFLKVTSQQLKKDYKIVVNKGY